MITDMTRGTPAGVLWRFSIPMLLSMIFQQLYNIVDSIVAGRFIGEGALAAVGASYPVTMIFMAVATGCNIGCSVVVSQLFGAKNYNRMKTAVSTSLMAALVLAVGLTVSGLVASAPLMHLLRTPGDIFADAGIYLNIYVGGLVFLFLYNMCTGVFTALGDSRTPLYFLIGSSVANIGMDILFVVTFKMGVAGVAWATFLCQGVASVLATVALFNRLKAVPTTGAYERFSWRELSNIATIAVPSILQQSFISVGNLFIQSLVNGFGSAVIAGYSAAVKLNTFAIMGFSTLGNALSSFSAQNLGGGQVQRVRKGFRTGVLMAVCVALPFVLVYTLFGGSMIRLFLTNPSTAALAEGVRFLRLVAPFYLLICLKLMADGVLRGAGSMTYFMIATFGDLALRVVLAYILAPMFGALGIWLSWPIGWAVAAVLSMTFYLRGVWLPRKAASAAQDAPQEDTV